MKKRGRPKSNIRRERVYTLRMSDDDWKKLEKICDKMGYKNKAEAVRDGIRMLHNMAKYHGFEG